MFKKRATKAGLLGLVVQPDGITLVRIERQGQDVLLHECLHEALGAGEDVAALVQRLVMTHGFAHMDCVCLMPPDSHQLLQIEAPDVQAAELKAAVRWRIKDLIDFHIDDAVIDVFEVPPRSNADHSNFMNAVASRISAVQQQVDMLEAAELTIRAIDIPELAMRNIAGQLPEDVKGMALLDFTRSNGLMTLTRQQCLYLSRQVDVGADHLMQLATPTGADGLEGMDMRMQGLLDKIVLEVQRSLDYYESHFAQAPIGSLVIGPLEKPVPGMTEYLAANLRINVRMLELHDIVQTDLQLDAVTTSRALLGIGAALRMEHKAL